LYDFIPESRFHMRSSPLRSRSLAGATALVAVALTSCGDLLHPDRRVEGLTFEESTVTVTEGALVSLRPMVLDQDGRPFDQVPSWVEFGWSSSDPGVFDPLDREWLARGPGQATATVTFAGMVDEAVVRVNPVSMAARIPQAYLVQAVQRPDGSVPLVAGRAATLRVFATGDVVNFFQPEVEATFFVDGVEVGTRRFGLDAGGAIPGQVSEAYFESSWAVRVPGAWVRPGLSFTVELDPDAAFPLTDRERARFPTEGTRSVDVREVPEMEIRFVPIHQNQSGSTGSLAGGAAAWTEYSEQVFPIGRISRSVRSTFFTDAGSQGETDWYRIISEIWALRFLDGDDRYYYGVLRRHSGYAGLGYVGYPVSIGWDDMRTGSADPVPLAYTVFAHELGHNFGRWHAPACGPGHVDADFPHPGGVAGVYGLNHSAGVITRPSDPDLMGYCRPHWVSDYTWEGVFRFRTDLEAERRRWGFDELAGANEASDPAPDAASGPGLLVWGHVVDGRVRLEPAIAVGRARAGPASGPGPVVEGLDAAGQVVFRQVAETMTLGHGAPGSLGFSAAVPLDEAQMERVATIRVGGAGIPATSRRSARAATPDHARALAAGRAPEFALARSSRGPQVVWDAATYPLMVVRDALTGDVVAFAREGRLDLPVPADQLSFDLSDGVRSVRARPQVRR
jgi:hypothetical protein